MSAKPIPLVLKVENWPQPDLRHWNHILTPSTLFEDGGHCSHWSEGTRRIHAQNYGSWLSYISRTRSDLLQIAPVDRVTRETVQAFIKERYGRVSTRTIANEISSLAIVTQAFERTAELKWLFFAARSLYGESDPHRLKPPYELSAADIFKWSIIKLEKIARDPIGHPKSVAVEFRQALMIGLLISCPVRVRALIAMTLDEHVEIMQDIIKLSFSSRDMKDKKPRRVTLHSKLHSHFLAYLDEYRPRLLGQKANNALWISERGNALNQDSFTGGLAIVTKRVFGIALRPHAFRHVAATSIALYAPQNVGIIRDILGHATLSTSLKHYNRATAMHSSQRLQSALRQLKNGNPSHRRLSARKRRSGDLS